jgi:hypothetical protein
MSYPEGGFVKRYYRARFQLLSPLHHIDKQVARLRLIEFVNTCKFGQSTVRNWKFDILQSVIGQYSRQFTIDVIIISSLLYFIQKTGFGKLI